MVLLSLFLFDYMAICEDEVDIEQGRDVFERVCPDGDDVGEFALLDGSDSIFCTDECGCIDGCGDEAVFVGHSCIVHVDELLGVCAVGSYADIGAEGDVDSGFMRSGEGVLDEWSDGGGFGADCFGEEAINFGFILDELSGVDCGDEVGVVLDEEIDGFVVEVGAMLDRGDTCAECGVDSVGAVGVGGDFAAHHFGGLDDGFEFVVEELLIDTCCGWGEDTTCGGDFDEVDAFADAGADGFACFGWAVGGGHVAWEIWTEDWGHGVGWIAVSSGDGD